MDKVAGVGIINLFIIVLVVMFSIVASKTLLTNYYVKGLSEVVQAV